MIRILIAEDQDLVRGALAALLNLEEDFEVVAEVDRGDQVVPAAVAGQIDVALLDIEMPGMDGITACALLRRARPETRALIVTTFGRSGYLRRAMESGAAGFLLKDAPAGDLAVAIRRVMRGERVVDPQLAADALSDGVSPLTSREREVLLVSAGGVGIKEIARQLHLAEGTVRNHLSMAIQKLYAQNRHQAVQIARDKGWL